MNIQFRQLFLLMLVPPPWLFPTIREHGSSFIVLATLCGPPPSTCFPAPLPQPCQQPLIPPPLPPAPPPSLPLSCPMPCLPSLPPAPLPPHPVPCPTACPSPPPPAPPPPPHLPQLPCPAPCPPCPLPPPRLPMSNVPCLPSSTHQQPFLSQPVPQPSLPNYPIYQQQNQYHLASSQVPYALNQQLQPPSYATKPVPQTFQIPLSSPYSPQPGLSYGYGYGRQTPMISTYTENPYYSNPIPAKEKFVHITEEKQEQQQISHEKVKDPFEKIEENEQHSETENKSGGDERTKVASTRQRINPQLHRDETFDSYAVRYVRPTVTPIDVMLPKPMPPIIYPTAPVYQQQQTIIPSTIYQPSHQSQQLSYPQIQYPPCPPAPITQPIPAPNLIQNCCLRCGVPCKANALFKSYGVRTITKPYLHSGISSVDELAFHTKGEENKCNDKELAVILGEAFAVKMNLAKEKILGGIEQRFASSTLFHIVCAPKMLEYIIHSEKFCAGDVADGVCFVFRT